MSLIQRKVTITATRSSRFSYFTTLEIKIYKKLFLVSRSQSILMWHLFYSLRICSNAFSIRIAIILVLESFSEQIPNRRRWVDIWQPSLARYLVDLSIYHVWKKKYLDFLRYSSASLFNLELLTSSKSISEDLLDPLVRVGCDSRLINL